jgi:hypothetical protein
MFTIGPIRNSINFTKAQIARQTGRRGFHHFESKRNEIPIPRSKEKENRQK